MGNQGLRETPVELCLQHLVGLENCIDFFFFLILEKSIYHFKKLLKYYMFDAANLEAGKN